MFSGENEKLEGAAEEETIRVRVSVWKMENTQVVTGAKTDGKRRDYKGCINRKREEFVSDDR